MDGAVVTVQIRDATEDDLATIQEIYADHVLNGLASFEETPPDITEIMHRFATLRNGNYPYLVAVVGNVVRGFAYAGPYRPRPAYRFSVENSIYLAADAYRQGIGSALLDKLIERCTALGFRQMLAVIGDSDNSGSIALHLGRGFLHRATNKSVGFKHGRWVDQVIMQRALGEGDETLP